MNFLLPLLILLLVKLNCLKGKESSQPPHIIFIFADDLGWNDISLHGSAEIPTPNIDALALNGLILHNYYTWWLCTPSRGSFLTGKYPTRLGLQHSALRAGEASGLPLYEVTLPQRLKKLGYRTHMIGKWHLGYQTKEHTPTYRGFDTFFGYLNGYIDYYDHTIWEDTLIPNVPYFYGLDFHNGTTVLKDKQGQYATHLFTEEAENIILNHDTSKPLFLFLSHIAAHTGNGYRPHQAPPEVISKFKYIKNISRRIHAAIISVMDDGVGKVFQALDQKGMLKNSIVMFVSDNGGSRYPGEVHASNYPLRGEKETQWEGGIRVPAAIWSPLLKLDKPRISKQLMHVSDWLPTFYTIGGGDIADLGQIDGYDQWEALMNDSSSPRKHMLQNLDQVLGMSAFRLGDLKLVNGTASDEYNFWYGPSGFESINMPSSFEWVFKNGSVVKDILVEKGMWIADNPNDVYKQLRVICERPPPKKSLACQPNKKPCLFNITDDPCEYMDLADQYPDEVNSMLARIAKYKEESMEPQSKPCDASGDPMCHDFLCVPWLDPEHRTECDYASGSVYTDEVDITNSRPPGLSSRNNTNFILIYTQFLFIIFLSKLLL